ncbi:MAG TPA: septum site-determining protein MinC [Chloroflexi bacterium]|nr:MAG: septum site-determining protein MinC [Chloroflexota bacterium]HDD55175.1 septum site-determining protein MinC [Chloroflexota bacterium]
METEKIEVKGIKNGLLIELRDGDWDEQKKALMSHINENKAFFKGAKLVLDVGDRPLKSPQLSSLRGELSDREIKLKAVLSTSLVTERASQDLGLEIKIDQSSHRDEKTTIDSMLDGDEAVFLERTLRSGHKVSFPGHIVVLGDVNPGAELIAGGNIIVWGRLRGVVHAGASGDLEAVVCALDLSPTQLRIADKISVSPPRKAKPKPEIARLENDQVVAQEWKAGT